MPSKELIEKVAKAINGPFHPVTEGSPHTLEQLRDIRWQQINDVERSLCLAGAKAAISTIFAALQEPTEGMTGSVRHIMMWLGETRPTEKTLMEMCERRGVEPPDGCGVFDHVPSKAAQAYWIWQQMLAASLLGEQSE